MRSATLATPLLFAVPAFLIAASTPSSIALTASPNASIFGRPVFLVATVTPATATGSVAFYDGTDVLGTAQLAGGQAALTTVLLPSGSRSLKAHYSGDANSAPSASATLVQIVNAIPGGEFQAAVNYAAGNNPVNVTAGDFNGDGKADLAVANTSGNNVSVLLGNGDGTFRAAVNYATGFRPASVVAGDFNADGNADLAVANSSGISVLLGKGDGTFRAAVNYIAGNNPFDVAVGDFNADGNADLVALNLFGGNVSVLLGNGDGTFRAAINSAGSGSSFVIDDFNGDGTADLAVGTANGVTLLLGNGDGTFRSGGSYGPGNNSYSIAAGDAASYGAGNALYSIGVGDFNGDGTADLVAAGNSISVFFGNGDGTFRAPVNYAGGNNSLSIAVGEFNGDGRADLAVANSQGGNVSVLLGVAPAPDLSVVVTHSGIFAQGQIGAIYTITVSNVGYAPTSGTVAVNDSLPPGLAATSIIGMGWTCVLGAATCMRGDPLAQFASYPAITVMVAVGAGAAGGITNTVSTSGGGETNLANDTATDFTTTFSPIQVTQAWSSLSPPASLATDAVLLMTDGTVMVHQGCSSNWYRLAPDSFGNYATGTWSQLAPMQAGYGPSAFSSAVLADGRLVVIGGEYNNPCGTAVDTNLGAIYDPTTNTWMPLSAPSGWPAIGDAPNVVLPDGQFLLAGPFNQIAKLNPATLTWTNLKGAGKADQNSEEGWTLLPDGTVLTVDVQAAPQSERYIPQSDLWAPAGTTIAPLITGAEIGPQVLRPDGTVFVAGATGQTAVYNASAGTWAAGPDFPLSNARQLAVSDGPGSLLPSGNVLIGASTFSPGVAYSPPTYFFEFDGAHLNPVPAPPSAGLDSTWFTRLLLLPTGQVLFTDGPDFFVYTPEGSPDPAWAPTIATAPSVVQTGLTYTITGTQLNGLSQAVAYGDDFQAATNYPLVRIVNTATKHVFYCRTHNHSSMGVATGAAVVSTQFDIPPSVEAGPSTLVVVANGIASKPWSLNVATTVTIGAVEGGGLSVPAVTTISANGYFTIFGANFAPLGTSRQLAASDIVNGSLPTNLGSTCVKVGPASAFLSYVSPAQINAIAPPLPTTGPAAISVVANCGAPNEITSPAINVPVAAASPEFLYWEQLPDGRDPVIAVDAVHGDYIGPPSLIAGLTFRPARAGDILTLYGIGFGRTASGPSPGLVPQMADSVPPGYSVTIGGTTSLATYVGISPGSAGLYQVNVTIPTGIAPGFYSIVLNVNGASTPPGAFLAIGP